MRVGLDIKEIIDRDNLEIVSVILDQRLQDLPSDSTEAINTDLILLICNPPFEYNIFYRFFRVISSFVFGFTTLECLKDGRSELIGIMPPRMLVVD